MGFAYWADENNKAIADLVDFTKTFMAKHALLNVLTKYCVFTSEDLLLVLRPYQIAATERILSRIEISSNYKKTGTLDAGGYIMAHHRQRQDADLVQDCTAGVGLAYMLTLLTKAGCLRQFWLWTCPAMAIVIPYETIIMR